MYFDNQPGWIVGADINMPLISVTRLRLRSYRYLLPFSVYSALSTLQAKYAAGNLGVGLLINVNKTFWTQSAWQNEMCLHSFIRAGYHGRVMPKLLDWADEASTVHWEQDTPKLPDWYQAHQRMVREGFRGKLKYPSPAHIAYEIAEPEVLIQKFTSVISMSNLNNSLNALTAELKRHRRPSPSWDTGNSNDSSQNYDVSSDGYHDDDDYHHDDCHDDDHDGVCDADYEGDGGDCGGDGGGDW